MPRDRVMRLLGATLGGNNPFHLAAAMSPYARSAMAAQSPVMAAVRKEAERGVSVLGAPTLSADGADIGTAMAVVNSPRGLTVSSRPCGTICPTEAW